MRVFVVDDSADVRQRMSSYINSIDDAEVVGEAADTIGVVEQIWKLQPDIVTLDLDLPHGSGIYIIQKLKRFPSPPVVVVLTEYPVLRQISFQEGADYFLDKTREFDKLSYVFHQVQQHETEKRAM